MVQRNVFVFTRFMAARHLFVQKYVSPQPAEKVYNEKTKQSLWKSGTATILAGRPDYNRNPFFTVSILLL